MRLSNASRAYACNHANKWSQRQTHRLEDATHCRDTEHFSEMGTYAKKLHRTKTSKCLCPNSKTASKTGGYPHIALPSVQCVMVPMLHQGIDNGNVHDVVGKCCCGPSILIHQYVLFLHTNFLGLCRTLRAECYSLHGKSRSSTRVHTR